MSLNTNCNKCIEQKEHRWRHFYMVTFQCWISIDKLLKKETTVDYYPAPSHLKNIMTDRSVTLTYITHLKKKMLL